MVFRSQDADVHWDARHLPPTDAKGGHRISRIPVFFQVAEAKYKAARGEFYRSLVECWDTSLTHHQTKLPPFSSQFAVMRYVNRGSEDQTLNTHERF